MPGETHHRRRRRDDERSVEVAARTGLERAHRHNNLYSLWRVGTPTKTSTSRAQLWEPELTDHGLMPRRWNVHLIPSYTHTSLSKQSRSICVSGTHRVGGKATELDS